MSAATSRGGARGGAARPVDALVAEIGSTTTVVSAFDGLSEESRAGGAAPCLVGQGAAATSVLDGDVTVGVDAARERMEAVIGPLTAREFLATSSAAGGLRMTVHGLTAKMTAMAAREAVLGAGGVVEYQTAGKLRRHDLARIAAARPNAIMLAGGVEGGDVDTVLHNAEWLAQIDFAAPLVSVATKSDGNVPVQDRVLAAGRKPMVIYGGNSAVCDEACQILVAAGFEVRITPNVYPGVDELDVLPARAVIHDAFEEHITHAPGMERIGALVTGKILPTPGAVLVACERLAAEIGDLLAIDVGGATTDVHSVTDGSVEYAALQTEPQPHSKRTVEGDLGTYVSAAHVVEMLAQQERPTELPPAIPTTEGEAHAALTLAHYAAVAAVQRHAGQLTHLYTPTGRQTVARGRDLTACRWVIGTGGAFTRLPGAEALLSDVRARNGGERLLPPRDARCVVDRDYIFACCGVLLAHFPAEPVVALMRGSCGV